MALATSTALLLGGAAAAAGTAYAASKGASAAERAGQLTADATAAGIASQERMYNQTRADNEPFRQVGIGAAGALANSFGLVSPQGGAVAPGGSLPAPAQTGANGPAVGSPDLAAYRAMDPGVEAEFNRVRAVADPNSPQWQKLGLDSLDEWTLAHAARSPDRVMPTVQAQVQQAVAPQSPAPAATPQGSQPGYSDPTATGGYTAPARQDYGERPTFERAMTAPLDVSLSAFRVSPDYEFRVAEGNKALDRIASATGGIMSGQRLKAATRFNQNIADSEYTDWRDYVTGQYNTNRAFDEAQFQSDRAYGDGVYTGDRAFNEGVYQTDRGRLDQRYDQRNNTLLSMAGFGQAANAQNQSAAQSFANNSTNLAMTGAQAQGNAGINAANAWSGGLNNLMTMGAYMYGNRK